MAPWVVDDMVEAFVGFAPGRCQRPTFAGWQRSNSDTVLALIPAGPCPTKKGAGGNRTPHRNPCCNIGIQAGGTYYAVSCRRDHQLTVLLHIGQQKSAPDRSALISTVIASLLYRSRILIEHHGIDN